MTYSKTITLKDGRLCTLRNGTAKDAQGALDNFNLTHAETPFLMTYPDENCLSLKSEASFLEEKSESDDEVELLAVVDGKIVGSAGYESTGLKAKLRHRAEFGISIESAYWGLGIGRALTLSCIDLARQAGFLQLELEVVAENERAIALYKSAGFVEYGRNPRGFRTREGRYQELVLMRLELDI